MKQKIIKGVPILLAAIAILLLVLSVPPGVVYGSHVDWFSQHTALAETIRNACLEQRTLAPSFLPLGGGSNGFQFSYYGYFRLDILVGCLLPGVPMLYLVIAYALAGYLASVLLFYQWLKENDCGTVISFGAAILFMSAACFFQTHRQIMFINYMPFLILGLVAVKRKRAGWFAVCLSLIYLHSFYFAIACLAVTGWYWMEVNGWKDPKAYFAYIKAALLSIGMAAVLLVPTALVLLEHRRSLGTASGWQIWGIPNGSGGLLYSPYGMGLSLAALYLLLAGITVKSTRTTSIACLTAIFWGPAAWLLNGFLYGRAKVLIPFLPLVLLICAKALRQLYQERRRYPLWPFGIIVPVTLYYLWTANKTDGILAVIDMFLLLAVCLWQRHRSGQSCDRQEIPVQMYAVMGGLILIMPCIFFIHANRQEEYVTSEEAKARANRSEWIAQADKPGAEKGDLYRMDSLAQPLADCNYIDYDGQKKSSMYSSITNAGYSDLYYSLLQTPVRINNRVALLPSQNPFLMQQLGIRYLVTTKNKIPSGYHAVSGEEGLVLAENPDVLPIARVTEAVMPKEQFDSLNSIEKLEALLRYTVVPEADSISWEPEITSFTPQFKRWETPDTVQIEKTDSGYVVKATEKSTLYVYMDEVPANQILMLEFQVVRRSAKAVVIDINKIRNKLSGSGAAYPNENTCFHYQLTGTDENPVKVLQITVSEGSYELQNIQWNQVPKTILTEKKYISVREGNTDIKDIKPMEEGWKVISCEADAEKDGWFVTSIPLQNGIKILIDGKNVPALKVNEAFAGARIKAGHHQVQVIFSPPGKSLGYIISLCSLLILGAGGLRRKVRRGRRS